MRIKFSVPGRMSATATHLFPGERAKRSLREIAAQAALRAVPYIDSLGK